MPTLSRKLYVKHGITVFMYPNDHDPAHVHVSYGGQTAKYLLNGKRVEDKLPRQQEKLLRAWLLLNEDDLVHVWEALRNGQTVEPID